jgi:hypothetical protein
VAGRQLHEFVKFVCGERFPESRLEGVADFSGRLPAIEPAQKEVLFLCELERLAGAVIADEILPALRGGP